MCGIVGLVLKKDSDLDQTGFVLERVESLQHRGYQGVGIAAFENKKISYRKSAGSIQNLKNRLGSFKAKNIVIAHNRWHTHGIESDENSHPHLSNDSAFAVVHNGEVYNKKAIKEHLESKGFKFYSDTDTECIPNLIQYYYKKTKDVLKAFQETLNQLDGSNAILLISSHTPNKIYVYNNCQTLSFIDTSDYYLIISDDAAIPSGRYMQYKIEDDDVVVISPAGFEYKSGANRKGIEVDVDLTESVKGGYSSFMEKEILQQPETLTRTITGRIDTENWDVVLGLENKLRHPAREYSKIILIGIGTSYNSCLIGKYFIEKYARIHADAIMGSEYLNHPWIPIIDKTLVVLVSQSGKTAELLDIAKFLIDMGVEVISICNVVKSPLAFMTGAGIFLKAGPEKAVASTKAYTSQIVALHLLSLLFAIRKGMDISTRKYELQSLQRVPELVEQTIELSIPDVQRISNKLLKSRSIFILGRGASWHTTFEASLKIQEVSYIHAHGYSASELFHGPRAMLDKQVPCILIANAEDNSYKQMVASAEKCNSANSPVIAVASESIHREFSHIQDVDYVRISDVDNIALAPYINIIPFQLLALKLAELKGYDADYPRNLAKVITTR